MFFIQFPCTQRYNCAYFKQLVHHRECSFYLSSTFKCKTIYSANALYHSKFQFALHKTMQLPHCQKTKIENCNIRLLGVYRYLIYAKRETKKCPLSYFFFSRSIADPKMPNHSKRAQLKKIAEKLHRHGKSHYIFRRIIAK